MDKKTFSRIVSVVSAAAIGCSWTLGAIPPAAAAAQQEISAENAQEEQLIPVIVKLKGDSVLASDQAADMGAEFIDSPQAEKISTVIESLQDRAEGYLRQLYPDLEIGFRYSLVFNGFSCQLPESVIEEAKSSPLIEDICPSCTYSAPKPMMTESGSMAGVPEFQEITGATGEGELIAILDTELNTAHSMFMAIDALDNKLSKEQVSTLAKDKKFTSEVDPEKAYVSSKLPYVYDYSDDTPYEVADEDIYHGTHVAGIAAGNRTATPKGDPISGIAPDAQIAFMKKLLAEGHKVTLLLSQKRGPLIDRIPDGVRILTIPMKKSIFLDRMMGRVIDGRPFAFPVKCICKVFKILIGKKRFTPFLISRTRELPGNYDLALEFHGYGKFPTAYTAVRVKAARKALLFHDASIHWLEYVVSYLDCYDRLYCV
ncbi:MAG: S8 family serine peptidase, partial [Ruminococcus sp.]|nr:S8 family serine peptidase [Ruminococcus sp.]